MELNIAICYTYTVYGRTFEGETFAVVHKTHYSLENFCHASGQCHYVLYTASDSRGKLSQLANQPRISQKFSPLKVLPYMVIMNIMASYYVCQQFLFDSIQIFIEVLGWPVIITDIFFISTLPT